MSKPILYLHIGHPKTASTTLQEFLYRNWNALEKAGYSLPTSSFGITEGTDNPPGNPLWTLEKLRESNDAAQLLRWVSEASAISEKLILSSECLIQEGYPQLFQEVSQKTNIHLIYYVRRQDKLLLSAWRQWGLKRGLSLNEFLKRRLKNQQPNFKQTIERWTDVCDIKQCHVRFLDPRFLEHEDVVADFCSAIDFENTTPQKIEDQNVSVDARLALFMSSYPELFESVHDEEIFTLLRQTPEDGVISKLNWSPEQFGRVREAFEPLNQQLLTSYHPTHRGIPVIDSKTAPLGDLPTLNEQIVFISEQLKVASDPTHPKLLRLAEIIAERRLQL